MDKAKELVLFCVRSAGIVRTKLSTRRMREGDLYTCETSMQDWLLGLIMVDRERWRGKRGYSRMIYRSPKGVYPTRKYGLWGGFWDNCYGDLFSNVTEAIRQCSWRKAGNWNSHRRWWLCYDSRLFLERRCVWPTRDLHGVEASQYGALVASQAEANTMNSLSLRMNMVEVE